MSPWNKSGSVFDRLVLCAIPFHAQGFIQSWVGVSPDWRGGRRDSGS